MSDSYIGKHEEVIGNFAYTTYDDGTYVYHCTASANYNPESATDLALTVWRLKRVHKANGTIRILGGGSPVFPATDVATVAALFT